MKFILSSMALLGLTNAQLGVYRSKAFTMGSLTPMHRLLNIGDNVTDDLILNVKCDDGTNARDYYYNAISAEDVDQFICPSYYGDTTGLKSYSADQKTCPDVMASYPSDTFISEHQNTAEYGTISQDNGALICLGDADVEFELYKQGMPEWNTVAEMYDLRTYQYACIEDDNIEIIFLFGMRDFWEGADMCFDNSPYLDLTHQYAAPDFPFVVDNNCYNSSWYDCHTEGYKLKVHVFDHENANLLAGLDWPIRLPKMYVKISFDYIYDYFQIFPDDKAKISLYLAGTSDPQSVMISPADAIEPVCEPDVIADTIACNNLDVYCRDPTDDVKIRIIAAGEFLNWEMNCADLVSGGFDYVLKNSYLTSNSAVDYSNYEAEVGPQDAFQYAITEDLHGQPITAAFLRYEYGTFIKSQEAICFTGDFFPFTSPSCKLQNYDPTDQTFYDVNTNIHNANEYFADDSVVELVINQDVELTADADYTIYQNGQPLVLDEQMEEAISGYINVDYIHAAVASQLNVMELPSCGVLTKQGTTTAEQSFAMFWTYSVEESFTIELGVGDQVDLSNESVLFTGDEDCVGLQTNFEYIVDANMPVDGATTTGYIRQGEGAGAEKLTATTIGLTAFMSAKISQLF